MAQYLDERNLACHIYSLDQTATSSFPLLAYITMVPPDDLRGIGILLLLLLPEMEIMAVLRHKVTLALALVIVSVYFGVGELGVIAVLTYAILSNLSERQADDDVSGYTVFNRNQTPLPGSLTIEDFDRARRNESSGRGDRSTLDLAADIVDNDAPAIVQRVSKAANKPCPCNSGLKFKKCCGKTLTKEELERRRQWETEWT